VQIELLPTSDDRWLGVLSRIGHDVYHRPEYVRADNRHMGGQAAALYGVDARGSEFLLPLLICALPSRLRLPDSWRDAAAPYGYPAPIASTPEPEALNRFLRLAASVVREHNIVSLFLRWHPLLSPGSRLPIKGETIVNHGDTVYIDLAESPDEWQRQTHSGHRYEIRRLRKLNFRVIVDDWSHLATFQEMYRQTMQRVAAREKYNFTFADFQNFHESLGPLLHIASVVSPQGELAASALFMECAGIVQYHLSGSTESFLRLAPTKLLIDEMRYWAKDRGNRVLHLGGGLSGTRDSLFEFKAGFSRHRGAFHTSRIVTDSGRFQLAVLADPLNDPSQHDNFFPPYRRAA
jgi:hypothetical protein